MSADLPAVIRFEQALNSKDLSRHTTRKDATPNWPQIVAANCSRLTMEESHIRPKACDSPRSAWVPNSSPAVDMSVDIGVVQCTYYAQRRVFHLPRSAPLVDSGNVRQTAALEQPNASDLWPFQ